MKKIEPITKEDMIGLMGLVLTAKDLKALFFSTLIITEYLLTRMWRELSHSFSSANMQFLYKVRGLPGTR